MQTSSTITKTPQTISNIECHINFTKAYPKTDSTPYLLQTIDLERMPYVTSIFLVTPPNAPVGNCTMTTKVTTWQFQNGKTVGKPTMTTSTFPLQILSLSSSN
jgi:hypothetical protein